jgi:hypothetical protein
LFSFGGSTQLKPSQCHKTKSFRSNFKQSKHQLIKGTNSATSQLALSTTTHQNSITKRGESSSHQQQQHQQQASKSRLSTRLVGSESSRLAGLGRSTAASTFTTTSNQKAASSDKIGEQPSKPSMRHLQLLAQLQLTLNELIKVKYLFLYLGGVCFFLLGKNCSK